MKYLTFAVAVFMTLLGPAASSQAQDQSVQYLQAGNTFYSQKNYDQAIRYYQAATQMNANSWQAYQGLGGCYYAKGDNSNALANYQKSLDINPNNPQVSQFVQYLKSQSTAPPLPTANDNTAATGSSPVGSTTSEDQTLNPNLPKKGKIVLEVEDSDWVGSWNDLENFYGTSITTAATPIGVKLGLGAAYAISPNFQLGAKFQFLLKTPELVTIDSAESEQWNESALGGAIEGDGVFPMGDGINFISSFQVGFYALVGTTVTATGIESGTANLSGSAPGGMITAGIELLLNSKKTLALDIGLDYQFLSFTTITDTPTFGGVTGTPFTLKNASNGANSSLDFSGVGLTAGIRFF